MRECRAKSYCNDFKGEGCNKYCRYYVLLKAIYSTSNIPKKYRFDIELKPAKDDLETFIKLNKFKENILQNVEDGRGLFLFGRKSGSGKTSWACKIANYYIRKNILDTEITNEILFVNVPEYFQLLREGMNDEESANKGKILKDKLLNSKLVILDDIGAENSTNWISEQLYIIINHRDNEMLSTIYTSNCTIAETGERLNNTRISSRLKSNNQVFEFKTKTDKRGC